MNSHMPKGFFFIFHTLLTSLVCRGRDLTACWFSFTLLSHLLAEEKGKEQTASFGSENLKIELMFGKLLGISTSCDKECPRYVWTLALAI